MSDPNKLSVIDALHDFSKRTQEIIDRIGDRTTMGSFEKGELQGLYRALKDDLKDAARCGRLSPHGQQPTDWERYYFAPAVMKAANSLRARSNTHPLLRTGWARSWMRQPSLATTCTSLKRIAQQIGDDQLGQGELAQQLGLHDLLTLWRQRGAFNTNLLR